jgi:hypothetical protein
MSINILKNYEELLADINNHVINLKAEKLKRLKVLFDENDPQYDSNLSPQERLFSAEKLSKSEIPTVQEIINSLPIVIEFKGKYYFTGNDHTTGSNNELINKNRNKNPLVDLRKDGKLIRSQGDKIFLHDVDTDLSQLYKVALYLLMEIRKIFPGELKKLSDHRYLEKKPQFWGVQYQVTNKKLRINIWGKPTDFNNSRLKLTLYNRVYSYSYIANKHDVDEALKLIKKVLRNKIIR